MNHQDHVNLISPGIPERGGIWADFGSGRGAFTLALAEVIGDQGVIYSVDRDNGALRRQSSQMRDAFSAVQTHYIAADFTRTLTLPALDGIIMANALHFIVDKLPVVERIKGYLKPRGRLILVEYNTDRGNRWVPYPLTYHGWEALAQQAGFASTRLLKTRPSSFLGEFFSALSMAPADETNP